MVTFIAPSFREETEAYVFIGAMLNQHNPNWKAIIYNNGPNPWLQLAVADAQDTRYSFDPFLKSLVASIKDPRIVYVESPENSGAWGCHNRMDAVRNMVDTDFVVQTSIQDYWLPNTVDEIAAHRQHDFIYWNSINHLAGYDRILDSMPVTNYIDWGNFAVRTDIAKQVGIRQPNAFTADGIFVQDCIKEGLIKNPKKIHKLLTIHN